MKVTIEAVGMQASNSPNWVNVAIVCPHCGHQGTFEPIINDTKDVLVYEPTETGARQSHWLGIRKCPNKLCKGQLFFIADSLQNILFISPNNTISFEKDNIPDRVLNTFEEAILCHSNRCFIASAIMIRKTLEEICLDRGAEGNNLYNRLEALKNKILLPNDLFEAMNELRLIGNDAAHLEAKTYEEIGEEEVEVSILFTKEILKAVYQYEHLLQRMRSLKSKPIQQQPITLSRKVESAIVSVPISKE